LSFQRHFLYAGKAAGSTMMVNAFRSKGGVRLQDVSQGIVLLSGVDSFKRGAAASAAIFGAGRMTRLHSDLSIPQARGRFARLCWWRAACFDALHSPIQSN